MKHLLSNDFITIDELHQLSDQSMSIPCPDTQFAHYPVCICEKGFGMLDASAGYIDHASTQVEPGDLYSASEQLFFLGSPVAHVVAWEEWLRESRRQKVTAASRRTRRPLSVG